MSSLPTGSQLLALSNAVSAAYRTRFLPSCVTGLTMNTQRTVLYYDATTEVGVDGTDTGSGSNGASPESPQVSYLLNWAIAGTYRGGHPRTYLPGVSYTDTNADGTLVSTRRTALSTAAAGFLSDVNALSPTPFTSVQLGTVAFFRGHSALSPPPFKPFLSGTCNSRVATQRRRLRG